VVETQPTIPVKSNIPAGILGLVAELVEDEVQIMTDVEIFLMGLDSQPAVA
jgi:hypothetical protein